MLKDKLDISTKGKDNIGYDVDLNIIENGRNKTKIRQRKIVEYFNSLTKHNNYEENNVILSWILSDTSTKDIIDIDDLNENVTNVLVNNLWKTLLSMRKSKDDLNLKRYNIILILNSNVHKLNIYIYIYIYDI